MKDVYFVKNVMQRLAGFQKEIADLQAFFYLADLKGYDLKTNEDVGFFDKLKRVLEITDAISSENILTSILIFLERKFVVADKYYRNQIELMIIPTKQVLESLKVLAENNDEYEETIDKEKSLYIKESTLAGTYFVFDRPKLKKILEELSIELKIITKATDTLKYFLKNGVIKIVGDEIIKREEIKGRNRLLRLPVLGDNSISIEKIILPNQSDKNLKHRQIHVMLNNRTGMN